jgi:hypothetical protein
MISRSARAHRVLATLLISMTSVGGTHRASVDLSRGFTAILSRETLGCFQTFPSDTRSARLTSTGEKANVRVLGTVKGLSFCGTVLRLVELA